MFNYYQPSIAYFLGRQRSIPPAEIKRFHYHSFEDGLWDLLNKKNISKKNVFLIPNFYCVDVLDNIEHHGYKYVLYPVDDNFQIHEQTFISLLKKHKPSVVFIFHAAGITCELVHQKQWLEYISKKTLIIEDAVHRLINPEKITFIHSHHIIMDSLRKVSPLYGSYMYGSHSLLDFSQQGFIFSKDFLFSTVYYHLFRCILNIGSFFNNVSVTDYAFKVLKKHDDIIGDSIESIRGLSLTPLLHPYINFNKIETVKKKQAELYHRFLQKLTQPYIQEFNIKQTYYKHLHVYPLLILSEPKKLVSYLHKHDIIVQCKFRDSQWSREKGVLFLPLGPHVTNSDIENVCNKIAQYSAAHNTSTNSVFNNIY